MATPVVVLMERPEGLEEDQVTVEPVGKLVTENWLVVQTRDDDEVTDMPASEKTLKSAASAFTLP